MFLLWCFLLNLLGISLSIMSFDAYVDQQKPDAIAQDDMQENMSSSDDAQEAAQDVDDENDDEDGDTQEQQVVIQKNNSIQNNTEAGVDSTQEFTPSADQEKTQSDTNKEDVVSEDLIEHRVEPLEDIPSPEDQELGIDTVDLQDPSGNWLYKRIWWEKAESRYDKIKTAVNTILDSRMYFFEQRVNLDRSLFDPFYISLGLSRGELQESVVYLIEQLNNSGTHKQSKEQEKKSVISLLLSEQKNIETLQQQVEAISKIDHAIDEALTKLMNQINLSRTYEQEAWQYLRSIAQELSDKAARDHYYAMDTSWKNIKNIQRYIEGEFASHFNALVSEAKKQTELVSQSVKQLKEKGIDLKNMVRGVIENDDLEQDENELEQDENDEQSASWISKLMSFILWPFHKIVSLWHSFFG